MNTEFYFPLKKEQLLERPSDNRYWIENKFEIHEENSKRQCDELEQWGLDLEEDPNLISNSKHFSILFEYLNIYDNLQPQIKTLLIETLVKVFKNFVKNLESYLDSVDQSSLSIWRNCLKIFTFFTEWTVESYLNHSKTKKKEIKKGRRKIKAADSLTTEPVKKVQSRTGTKKKLNLLDSVKKDVEKHDNTNEEAQLNAENILRSLSKVVTFNLKCLFRNKIIEEDLINSMIKICFDLLEVSNETKNIQNKDKIFEILQILITKFQTNIQILLLKLTTKIVNLIYNQENLVNSLSDFVVLAINGDSNMNKLAVDIIHEISKTINEDENFDSQGLKNVGKFLVILSEKSPKTIYNNIPILIKLFDSESYVIRNTLVEVISNVIILILCNLDEINEVDTRNNYLKTKEKFIDILFDRIYDKSGFCRGKVLQIFEKLCDHNTISVSNYLRLLKEASGRLKDEKANVRKRAISLISKIVMIYAAIFKSERFLTYEEIENLIKNSEGSIEQHVQKIKAIEDKLIEISTRYEGNDKNEYDQNDLHNAEGLDNEKNNLKQEINKEQMVIEYFMNYYTVLKSIDDTIPLVIQLLGSKNISDVQETIELFIVLHKLRISSSFQGVKKMLTLIMKPEEGIRRKLIEAYREIYFSKEISLEMQAAYLIDLTVNLNFSEVTCLRELMKHLIQTNGINLNLFKEIWKILLRNPEAELNKMKITSTEELQQKKNQLEVESRSALQILNIASDYESSILLNNSDLYIKNILSNLQKKKIDWLLIKESLVGLQKIYSMKKDIAELCLLKIAKTILKGYGTDDNNWFTATQQMIDTIFISVTNPEKITQYLIIKLSRPLFVNKVPKNEMDNQFMSQNIGMTQGMEVDNQIEAPKNEDELTPIKLAQLMFVVGHVALNMVVYAEKLENNLKKKKNEKESVGKDKKHEDDIQEIAGGKEAEIEYDINLLHKIVEEEILYKNLLGKFAPLIINVAQKSLTASATEVENNLLLYKAAILSLCKFMCISQKFCEDNLPFMFDLLASDLIDPSLKLNVCAAFGDFINRFPNILQKQVSRFFCCLHSTSPQVRRYSMTVISHLVLNDMLKLKGEVVDICMLLEVDDDKLKDLVNLFFYELNQKGNNVIYNVIPKALAKLSYEYKTIDYGRFQNIVKTLMKYVEKDKHTEGLIDKLFAKLKNSKDIHEWRNTTFCLSLLNYNEKHVMKLLDLYSTLKEKIDDDDIVKENFQNIFNKYKKTNMGNGSNKEVIEELEKKFFSGEKIVIAKKEKSQGSNKKKVGIKRNYNKMKENADDDVSIAASEDVGSKHQPRILSKRVTRNTNTNQQKKSKAKMVESGSEDDFDEGYDSDF